MVTVTFFVITFVITSFMPTRICSLLKRELSRVSTTGNAGGEQPSDDTDDEFFSFTSTTSSHHGIDQELELYLSDESKQLDSLNKFPHVKELFLRFNTVERLFSAGGQILTPRRSIDL